MLVVLVFSFSRFSGFWALGPGPRPQAWGLQICMRLVPELMDFDVLLNSLRVYPHNVRHWRGGSNPGYICAPNKQ